jgi:hypothetical protein
MAPPLYFYILLAFAQGCSTHWAEVTYELRHYGHFIAKIKNASKEAVFEVQML